MEVVAEDFAEEEEEAGLLEVARVVAGLLDEVEVLLLWLVLELLWLVLELLLLLLEDEAADEEAATEEEALDTEPPSGPV
jgi:hypothetical protein